MLMSERGELQKDDLILFVIDWCSTGHNKIVQQTQLTSNLHVYFRRENIGRVIILFVFK